MTYEQYCQVNLSSLLSEPLFIGCPIEQLDTFTLNLLSYDEVIEIYLDTLGKSARLVSEKMAYKFGLNPLKMDQLWYDYLMTQIIEKCRKAISLREIKSQSYSFLIEINLD